MIMKRRCSRCVKRKMDKWSSLVAILLLAGCNPPPGSDPQSVAARQRGHEAYKLELARSAMDDSTVVCKDGIKWRVVINRVAEQLSISPIPKPDGSYYEC